MTVEWPLPADIRAADFTAEFRGSAGFCSCTLAGQCYCLVMSKTMAAKFAGKCAVCGVSFPKGTSIVYDGRASHVECVEAEKAAWAREDEEQAAFQVKAMADHKAGLRIKSTADDREITVTGAPSYEMAKAEAFAFVCSVRAAGGTARLVKHKRNGKVYLGRELVSYYGSSNLGHHEGYAFRYATA